MAKTNEAAAVKEAEKGAKVPRKAFLGALGRAGCALPELSREGRDSYVRLEAATGGVNIWAVGDAAWTVQHVKGEAASGLDVCVKPRQLHGILRCAKGDEVVVEVERGSDPMFPVEVAFTCGGMTMRQEGKPGSEILESGPLIGPRAVVLSAQTLGRSLRRVLPCVATDATRPIMECVCFTFKEGCLELAGADGFRLARLQIPGACACTGQVALPGSAVKGLVQMLEGMQGKVELCYGPGAPAVIFATESFRYGVHPYQGSYPNYPALIPTQEDATVRVSRADLAAAAGAAGYVAAHSRQLRILGGDDNLVTIQAGSIEEEGQVSITTPGEINRSPADPQAKVRVALNPRFLMAAVAACAPAKEVVLGIIGGAVPVTIRPVGDETYLQLIMPMHVQW